MTATAIAGASRMKFEFKALGCAAALTLIAAAHAEETLPVLKVGGHFYTNVTVTSVTASDLFFSHAGGMGSAKLKNLDPQLQKHFGFDPAGLHASSTLEVQARSRPPGSGDKAEVVPGQNWAPVEFVIVVSDETKERAGIDEQVKALLGANDFDGLDRLAKHFRESKETFPNGAWKLDTFYNSICKLPEADSPAVWRQRIQFVEDWVKARPESITARVAQADLLVGYAWQARGHSYADKVTDEAWRLFGVRMNEAAEVIHATTRLKENCPYRGVVLMTTALGLGADKTEYLAMADRLIKSEPHYVPYYSNPMNFLLPRWYGEEGDSERFLAQAADRLGGDDGDLYYARAAWRMYDMRSFKNVMRELQLSWPRVNHGFEVMEQRYPNSLSVLSQHACLATMAAEGATARKLMNRIQGRIDLSVWHTREYFDRVALWCATTH